MLRRRTLRHRDEQGVVAMFTALIMVSLLLVSAIVVDFGLTRLNRQMNKSAADAAVMAGLRGADGGTTEIFTERGVCTALAYLKANEPALTGLPDGTCSPSTIENSLVTCDPANPSAAMTDYHQTVTSDGVTYDVRIKSPYEVSEGGFSDEGYATLASDTTAMNGCDQLGVVITQSRASLFGSLATDDDLTTTIRSVGRVRIGDGDQAPALLLLERHTCNVLSVGSAGAGAGSHIRVYGTATTPGSIHADTNASDSSTCGTSSGKQVFQGKQADGLVAFGSHDGLPGLITSVAGNAGVGAGIVSDGLINVYSTTALDEGGSGTKTGPAGRGLVTRRPIDERFRGGVASAIGAAAPVWTKPATDYDLTIGCTPVPANVTLAQNLTSAQSLYIDCPGGWAFGSDSAPLVTGAGTVFVNGFIKAGGLLMPNATRVYVNQRASGSGGAGIKLGTGNAFCMRATSCSSSPVAQCSTTPTSLRARLFVRTGTITQTGGMLRMCNTTVYLLGGHSDGCVPTSDGTAPSSAPCPGATSGDGQLKVNGGYMDWTAPNAYDVIPESDEQAAWDEGEDLAFWAESAGSYSMAGGGNMQVVGVFMAPNAHPFELSGGGSQDLKNAQYIARTFALAGGATLSMTVDPESAVTVPKLDPFTMVR